MYNQDKYIIYTVFTDCDEDKWMYIDMCTVDGERKTHYI